MVIEWSDEDGAFIVTVPELPGCVTHGLTYAEAARQGEDAIATWLATARRWGDPVPEPRVFAGGGKRSRRLGGRRSARL
jgi:predicted RNase H-like HicB family nuclease